MILVLEGSEYEGAYITKEHIQKLSSKQQKILRIGDIELTRNYLLI